MKFIHNFRIILCVTVIGFVATSCHTNTKSNQAVSKADSAKLNSGDTITPKINHYTGIISSHPNDADAYWNRGKLEVFTNSLALALADLTKAVTLDTTKSVYYYDFANAEFLTGHTHEARDAFLTSIRLDPKNTDATLKLAELYLYVEKYDDALALIEQAIKVNPYIGKEYFLKGLIFIEKHDTVKAISSLQTAVEQNPNYFDAYIQLGLLFSAKGNPLALDYYNDASHLEPQNPEPYYDKGMFYQFGGDDTDAIKEYKELLQVDSTYKNAYYNLGVIYNEDAADYATSLQYFNKAIMYDTAYYMAYYGRGNCYEMLKQYDKALADYGHSYRINPQFTAGKEAYTKLKSKTH